MGQVSKRVYDEVAAAIRKMKDMVIADPATSHLLPAVIVMQREMSRAFAENNTLFRADLFATNCEPLFKPGRMGKQAAPEPAVTNGSEQSLAQTQPTCPECAARHERRSLEVAAQAAEQHRQYAGAAQQSSQQPQVALLATARYGGSSKPRTGERRTIGRADLYGRERRKQKPD